MENFIQNIFFKVYSFHVFLQGPIQIIMAQKPSIPKGTRDFNPVEASRRNYIFDTIRTVFREFGYAPIETPAMENLSTLLGKYGEEGDRLLFKILNSGDSFVTLAGKVDSDPAKIDSNALSLMVCEKGLRYDLTVPFARFVVQHQNDLAFPFKRYQIQPVWRADRPQKGRYREFYQCDADVIGSDSLYNELEMVQLVDDVFNRFGITWNEQGRDIWVPSGQALQILPDLDNSIPEIKVMPWPAFPADLMSLAIVVATQAQGSVLFHDWMYEGRMYFTDKLKKMGAQIVLCDPHRCIVQGPSRLYPADVESPDIRAGLSLVLAALAAKGKSTIRNAGQIDRGYERIEEKLKGLGARIERV